MTSPTIFFDITPTVSFLDESYWLRVKGRFARETPKIGAFRMLRWESSIDGCAHMVISSVTLEGFGQSSNHQSSRQAG